MLTADKGELGIPDFFNPADLERLARVPYRERAATAREWANSCGIVPATSDRFRIALLLIDVQNTFCLPDSELFVTGHSGRAAIDDNIRLCSFIYRNLHRLTHIVATLDTHSALQIFHPVFWVDEQGEHPPPYTQITLEQFERGIWRPNQKVARNLGLPAEDLQQHALHYLRMLADRYPLMIWPYHAMLGGVGHALVAGIEEALFFHSIARDTEPSLILKGRNALTENYSALRPEVMTSFDGRAIGCKETALIDQLLAFDALIIAGQAKSHCVAWTVDDLLSEIKVRDASLAAKVYLLDDCSSPVVVPGGDFTAHAARAFRRFAAAGMHVVRSTDTLNFLA